MSKGKYLPVYSPEEERLHVITHGAGLLLGLIAGIFLLNKSIGQPGLSAVIILYLITLLCVYLSSTLYHLAIEPARRQLLRTIDHICIFLLIAGTNTPIVWAYMDDPWRVWYLAMIWSLGVIGIILKLTSFNVFEKLSVPFYVTMGGLGIWALFIMYDCASTEVLWALSLGGICYFIGVAFYVRNSMKYHHVIWHLWVLLASALHFWAIWLLV